VSARPRPTADAGPDRAAAPLAAAGPRWSLNGSTPDESAGSAWRSWRFGAWVVARGARSSRSKRWRRSACPARGGAVRERTPRAGAVRGPVDPVVDDPELRYSEAGRRVPAPSTTSACSTYRVHSRRFPAFCRAWRPGRDCEPPRERLRCAEGVLARAVDRSRC
jgi:hypothetical protein